jgi:hypothetical protein
MDARAQLLDAKIRLWILRRERRRLEEGRLLSLADPAPEKKDPRRPGL